MRAEQLLRDGDIQGALQDIQEQIRNHPENSRFRIFLFQLLAVLGQWERALTQLHVVGEMEKDAWPLAHLYRGALQCELFRREVFAGTRRPMAFGEPPPWMALLLESLRLLNAGHYRQAVDLREHAFEQAAESPGQINEQSFAWLADADTRLGPVLEIIINGRYFWAPVAQISALSTNKPADLRDLVWLPAQFTWVNGGQAYGLLPVRYPDSETSADPAILMSRKTEWRETSEGIYQGLGQRMLATDRDEYPLLEVRSVQFG